jgi:hypothetical protein
MRILHEIHVEAGPHTPAAKYQLVDVDEPQLFVRVELRCGPGAVIVASVTRDAYPYVTISRPLGLSGVEQVARLVREWAFPPATSGPRAN